MKVRDLRIAKNYRDAVKKWGEPDIRRKRTIVAPPMSGALERDVNIKQMTSLGQDIHEEQVSRFAKEIDILFKKIKLDGENLNGRDKETFSQEYLDYKIWIEKEKELRKGLNSIGLSKGLLLSKSDRTALEERVLRRLLPLAETSSDNDDDAQEIEPHVIPTPPPLSKAQMRLLPLLRQPLPAALSILAEYCHNHKLRLLDLYTQMDKDKDWLVSRDEVRDIVTQNKIPLTAAQLEDMIIALDADNNDKLDYRELAQGVEAYRIDERWKKIRELMHIIEAHQQAAKKFQKEREKSSLSRKPIDGRKIGSASSAMQHLRGGNHTDDGDSSPDHLKLPAVESNDKSDSLASKARDKRLRKHRERKAKAKLKHKQIKGKGYLPSTMGGLTGQIKDRYAETTISHVKESLDMMHTTGIPIKEDSVKRVMLFPFDKPTGFCKTSFRQPGVNLASSSEFRPGFTPIQHESRGRHRGRNEQQPEDEEFIKKRKRGPQKKHKSRNSRKQSPFWTDANHSLLIEDIGRCTPQDSLFRIVKTPDRFQSPPKRS